MPQSGQPGIKEGIYKNLPFVPFNTLMLDTGYLMLDAGCWMLDTGYWMLDTGCWIKEG